MTITSAVSDSELFRDLVKRRKLTHPTSAAFDMKAWVSGAAALAAPTARDYELMLAAIYFGNSIAKLRPLLPAKLSEPFTRESGTRLLVGIANEQYLTLRRKSARLGKRLAREGGAGNLEQLAQSRISSPTGQSMTGDDHVTHLIDSLPHWLHQLVTLPADKKAPVVDPVDFEQREGRIARYGSLAVRRSLAQAHGSQSLAAPRASSPFCELISLAKPVKDDRTGLERWWLPANGRPTSVSFDWRFSQRAARRERMLEDLLYYRLALGQPDPEAFVAMLRRVGADESGGRELAIDLSAIWRRRTRNDVVSS
ncbi:MAG TPA: hypothetical protein VFO80_11610 [Sphingomonas sp.]|nr:hypothetical protein [Sphingomonas sp.]